MAAMEIKRILLGLPVRKTLLHLIGGGVIATLRLRGLRDKRQVTGRHFKVKAWNDVDIKFWEKRNSVGKFQTRDVCLSGWGGSMLLKASCVHSHNDV